MRTLITRRRALLGTCAVATLALLEMVEWADGQTCAPSGTAQYPNLFTSASGGPQTTANTTTQNTNAPYTVRPPWNVAGVDYKVGVPAGTTLISPSQVLNNGATLNTNSATTSGSVLHFASTTGVMVGMTLSGTNIPGSTVVSSVTPTSVTMSAPVSGTVSSGATITFGGVSVSNPTLTPLVSNIVFDSIALGGWAIFGPTDRTVDNTTVLRCTATASTQFTQASILFFGPGNGYVGCTNLTIQYCEIDNFVPSTSSFSSGSQAIVWSPGGTAPGNLTIEYCWIKNSNANLLSVGSYGSSSAVANYTFRYNIFENYGNCKDYAVHCEIAQTYASGLLGVNFTNGSANIAWNGGFIGNNGVFSAGVAKMCLAVGDLVEFYSNGSLPSNLTQFSTLYWVVAVNTGAQTFQVSATQGGSAIVMSGAGSGGCGVGFFNLINYIVEYNTIIQNMTLASFQGSEGMTFQGNSHSGIYGLYFVTPTASFSYNTCIVCCQIQTSPEVNVSWQVGLVTGQQASTKVQHNYMDPNQSVVVGQRTALASIGNPDNISPLPPSGYKGFSWGTAIVESNNINLATGGSIT